MSKAIKVNTQLKVDNFSSIGKYSQSTQTFTFVRFFNFSLLFGLL